jgi:hypothetical protein
MIISATDPNQQSKIEEECSTNSLHEGVRSMSNMLAIMFQSNNSESARPGFLEEAPIWQHMSDALHQSLYRVLSLLIAVLPGLLAFFVSVVVFALIGLALSTILRRGLELIHFNDRLTRNRSTVDWVTVSSPSAIVARVSFWTCLVIGLIVGVAAFDASFAASTSMSVSMLPYLTHIVGAILLLVVGTLIARFLARSVLIGAVNAQLQYARILSLGVKWLVLVLTAAMVLDHLQVGGTIVELAFGILFGGIVLTLSLAVGLGSRDLVSRTLESHSETRADSAAKSQRAQGNGPEEVIRHF